MHWSSIFSVSVTRNLMMCVLLFGVSWRWVVLGFVLTFVLFIEPPVVSLAPRWSYVSTTRRSFAPQGANMSRVWGRYAPTRSHRKCRRIEEVKSRWNTTFSRIENLWPRDGSCPLPLRSKPFLGNCFRIVKAQKISRGGAAHVRESPFAPNEVPASVCAAALSGSLTEGVRSWHGITFRRLMQDSRYNMKKAERSADTTFCFFQAQE